MIWIEWQVISFSSKNHQLSFRNSSVFHPQIMSFSSTNHQLFFHKPSAFLPQIISLPSTNHLLLFHKSSSIPGWSNSAWGRSQFVAVTVKTNHQKHHQHSHEISPACHLYIIKQQAVATWTHIPMIILAASNSVWPICFSFTAHVNCFPCPEQISDIILL